MVTENDFLLLRLVGFEYFRLKTLTMRKIYLATLFSIVYVIASFGQCDVCTPDLTCASASGSPALCPAQIPDATAGVFYTQQVTFYLPTTVSFNGSEFELQDVVITAINGLPEGIVAFFPNNDTTFSPGSGENHACVTLCGTAMDTGVYAVEIVIDGTVSTIFGPFAFPTQYFTFNFNVVAAEIIIPGCTNELACNFDSLANEDDGSCGALIGTICSDGDSTTSGDVILVDCICQGVADVFGCTDASACNFNPMATVDDLTCGPAVGSACDDGDTTTINDIILSNCNCNGTSIVLGCTDVSACNFNASATVDDGSCGAALGASCNDNDSTTTGDIIVEGCLCSGVSEIAGCTSLFSCNYNPEATIDDGSCLGFFGSACDDGDSSTVNDQVNFDCTCLGSPIIEGCTQQTACNYEPAANVDNGSCGETIGAPCDDNDPTTSNDAIINGCSCAGVTGVPGCTDFLACNYNPQATVDDGSCGAQLLSPCDDGDATTTNDITLPGCDCMGTPSVAGCTNPLACNYNPLAVTDDGSCGPPTGSLCDDGDANTSNDIILPGCLCVGNPLAVNYNNEMVSSIYPNPASNHIIIELADYSGWSVEVYSISGKLLLSQNCSRVIDLSGLGQGLYTLNLRGPNSSARHKLQIIR